MILVFREREDFEYLEQKLALGMLDIFGFVWIRLPELIYCKVYLANRQVVEILGKRYNQLQI